MFSFHKPKVYRSPTGCCICKAKSSSSRFTDSRKYEDDFVECFQLPSPRKGEICNACVLLVKRFKRLPPGSDRHWGHVVDARVGPGLKSMTKFKKKKEEKESAAMGFTNSNPPPEKFLKIMKKKSKKMREESALAAERKERENSPTPSDDSTPCSPLSYHSDADDNLSDVDCANGHAVLDDVSQGKENNSEGNNSNGVVRQRRKCHKPNKRKAGPPDCGGFLQPGYWSSVKMCCGVVFKGAGNELAIDIMNFKPCVHHLSQKRTKSQSVEQTDAVVPTLIPTTKDKVFSDNSSDSGYDEYSNQEKCLNVVGTEKEQDTLKVAKVINGLVVDDTKRINNVKPNFVLNGASLKSNPIKVSTGNLIKQNNIVLIKPKRPVVAMGNTFIVKSPSSVSSVTQVQQAAN